MCSDYCVCVGGGDNYTSNFAIITNELALARVLLHTHTHTHTRTQNINKQQTHSLSYTRSHSVTLTQTHAHLTLIQTHTHTQAKLQESIKLLDDFKEGRLSPDVTNKQASTLFYFLALFSSPPFSLSMSVVLSNLCLSVRTLSYVKV